MLTQTFMTNNVKDRKLFGDQRFNQLIQFAEYDKIASGTYDKHEQLMKELKKDEE